MKKVIFLTGATGLIGGNLIPRILEGDPATRLVLLIRGNTDGEAEQRLDEILWSWLPVNDIEQAKKRIRVVRGDITLNRLGLSESLYARLAKEVTHIIHSAATVQFQLPLECARSVNLSGTKNVIALAKCAKEAGKLQRVAYISTAYVSGNRGGRILEDELDYGQQIANTYEQTKLESEKFVRALMNELPIIVFRPSIVVGDSQTGRTIAFNVLYPPLKLIYRQVVSILPGPSCTSLDVVPVDFVSDAIAHIFLKKEDGIGRTYHITAGEEKAPTTGEVVDLAINYFNRIMAKDPIPPVKFLPLQLYRAVCGKRFLQAMEVYEPYLCVQRIFDNTNTCFALRGTKITPPPFKMYYQNMLRYCIETDWGKRLKSAAEGKRGNVMKIKVILNPKSKNGNNRYLESVLRGKFPHSLLSIERTAYPQHATEIAQRAVKENVDTIVAVGGDGTINEVLNGIVGTDVALAIIPTGTANDLASYYHIPTDIARACDVIIDHHVRRADLIRVNGWHYVTAGGIGLTSEVAGIANAIKSKGTAGKLFGQILGSSLYLLAVLCTLLRRRGRNPLSVRWNDGSMKANVLSLTVDNQPFLGKNFLVSPGAVNDDGMADICLIENSASLVRTLSILLKVLVGRHIYSSSVRSWRAKELMVDAEKPLAFLGDGEIIQRGTRFNIQIIPKALKVVIPVQKENL